MRSSLDDLLNEIDSALTPASQPTPIPSQPAAKSEIDDLLSEISGLESPPAPLATPFQPQTAAIPSKRREKCYFLCISGPLTPSGVSYSEMEPKVCASLRCTGCDHTVISFPDNVWVEDCEYYFFRNNYQRPTRLQEVFGT